MTNRQRRRLDAFASGAPIVGMPLSIGGIMVSFGLHSDDYAAISFGSVAVILGAILAAGLVGHIRHMPHSA